MTQPKPPRPHQKMISPDVLNDWHVTTEAVAGAETRLKAGSYPAITINKPLTIKSGTAATMS